MTSLVEKRKLPGIACWMSELEPIRKEAKYLTEISVDSHRRNQNEKTEVSPPLRSIEIHPNTIVIIVWISFTPQTNVKQVLASCSLSLSNGLLALSRSRHLTHSRWMAKLFKLCLEDTLKWMKLNPVRIEEPNKSTECFIARAEYSFGFTAWREKWLLDGQIFQVNYNMIHWLLLLCLCFR